MRARRRSSHTFTERESIAASASVVRLFTLRGVHIRQQHLNISSWHLVCFQARMVSVVSRGLGQRVRGTYRPMRTDLLS